MSARARIIIKGRVQKAGYRDFIDEIAFKLDLMGLVRNVDDGSVEVICEGERRKIEELIAAIRIDKYPIRVKDIDVKYSEPSGEFKEFAIVREEDITRATYERMDLAARYMREMHSDLSQKQDATIEKQDATFNAITAMNKDMVECFGRLDEKYGMFDQRMGRIEQDMREMKDIFARFVEHYIQKDSPK